MGIDTQHPAAVPTAHPYAHHPGISLTNKDMEQGLELGGLGLMIGPAAMEAAGHEFSHSGTRAVMGAEALGLGMMMVPGVQHFAHRLGGTLPASFKKHQVEQAQLAAQQSQATQELANAQMQQKAAAAAFEKKNPPPSHPGIPLIDVDTEMGLDVAGLGMMGASELPGILPGLKKYAPRLMEHAEGPAGKALGLAGLGTMAYAPLSHFYHKARGTEPKAFREHQLKHATALPLEFVTSFLDELAKIADDPNEATKTHVKGLKDMRLSMPHLRQGVKGEAPRNPFSGNTAYVGGSPQKVASTVADIERAAESLTQHVTPEMGYGALGAGTLLGGLALMKRTGRAAREADPNAGLDLVQAGRAAQVGRALKYGLM